MLPGPVFQVELVTTSRRRGYYAFRFVYGLVLLSIVGQNYLAWDAQVRSQFVGPQISTFALWTFGSFALVQMLAILALTPALVAGTIANEKQRKTLHYLLASRLTGAEVVLDALQMVHLDTSGLDALRQLHKVVLLRGGSLRIENL